MVDEILGAHTVNDDFWDNTNPTDVSIDTTNSKEKMVGSHITEFRTHTHKDKQPDTTELLNMVNLSSQENQDYDN